MGSSVAESAATKFVYRIAVAALNAMAIATAQTSAATYLFASRATSAAEERSAGNASPLGRDDSAAPLFGIAVGIDPALDGPCHIATQALPQAGR